MPPSQSVQFIATGSRLGLEPLPGCDGGIFTNPDIAFEFGLWISPEFEIYPVKEFCRLKAGWNPNRILAKINYRIQIPILKAAISHPNLTGFGYAL